jgi:hypothetical protein
MSEKTQANENVDMTPLEQIRSVLTTKHARITALEAALPTLGDGLVAEAVVFYLVAQNAEYFAMCEALKAAANSMQSLEIEAEQVAEKAVETAEAVQA